MPYKSQKQKRFFLLVKAVQQGRVSGKRVGSKISKAAKTMSPQDVDDFTHGKNLPQKKIKEIVECLKCLQQIDPKADLRYDITGAGSGGQNPIESMYLEYKNDVRFDAYNKPIDPHYLEENPKQPPLGRTGVAVPGSFYLDEDGEESNSDVNPIAKTFKQQGNFEQYIQRFSGLEMKPKEYESITNYSNAKPVKQDKFFVRYENTDEFGNNTITVIKKLREGNNLVFTAFQTTIQQTPPEGEEPTTENDIIVNKSRSFRDEIEGGKILADMLQTLEI